MTAWGVSMVKDEADVIETTIRHMARNLDGLIVADNGSTDGTREILDRLSQEIPSLTVVDDPETGYYQSRKITALAEQAAGHGADWIVPFDADELWVLLSSGMTISRALQWRTETGDQIITADVMNHWVVDSPEHQQDPSVAWPESMPWKDPSPGCLPKVTFRWQPGAVIEQGNHAVRLPTGPGCRSGRNILEVRHFPYRSPEQFERKARNGAAAYAAAPDIPTDVGAHWRAYGRILDEGGPGALREVWDEHFCRKTTDGMIHDPVRIVGGIPWTL